MLAGTSRRFIVALFAGLLSGWGMIPEISAQTFDGFAAPVEHQHTPLIIESRPIISRYKAALVRPRRVLLDPDGTLFVADWGADSIIRIEPSGRASVFATDLPEPAGLARDAAGNLYVAYHAEGMTEAGGIVRFTSAGDRSLFVDGLAGPTDLAFDASGNLYVSTFHDDSVVRITPDGMLSNVVSDIPEPTAIAFDGMGALYVASSTEGSVYRLSPMGELRVLARNLNVPTDLAFDPAGHLIVSNLAGTELSYIEPQGTSRTFAVVPKGTIAHTFDADGNLILANWDLHLLMKVTTNLSIPCPHCDRKIPLQLREAPKSEAPKPTQPVL